MSQCGSCNYCDHLERRCAKHLWMVVDSVKSPSPVLISGRSRTAPRTGCNRKREHYRVASFQGVSASWSLLHSCVARLGAGHSGGRGGPWLLVGVPGIIQHIGFLSRRPGCLPGIISLGTRPVAESSSRGSVHRRFSPAVLLFLCAHGSHPGCWSGWRQEALN